MNTFTRKQKQRTVNPLLGKCLDDMKIAPSFKDCKTISLLRNNYINIHPDFTFSDLKSYYCAVIKGEKIWKWEWNFQLDLIGPIIPPGPIVKSAPVTRTPGIIKSPQIRLIEVYTLQLPQNINELVDHKHDDLWHAKLIEYSISFPIFLTMVESGFENSDNGLRYFILNNTQNPIDIALSNFEQTSITPNVKQQVNSTLFSNIFRFKTSMYNGAYFLPSGYNISELENFLEKNRGYLKNQHVLLFREWNSEVFNCFVPFKSIDTTLTSDEVLLWTANELDIKYEEKQTTRKELWNLCKREIMIRFYDPYYKIRLLLLCTWCFSDENNIYSIFNRFIMPPEILRKILYYLGVKYKFSGVERFN